MFCQLVCAFVGPTTDSSDYFLIVADNRQGLLKRWIPRRAVFLIEVIWTSFSCEDRFLKKRRSSDYFLVVADHRLFGSGKFASNSFVGAAFMAGVGAAAEWMTKISSPIFSHCEIASNVFVQAQKVRTHCYNVPDWKKRYDIVCIELFWHKSSLCNGCVRSITEYSCLPFFWMFAVFCRTAESHGSCVTQNASSNQIVSAAVYSRKRTELSVLRNCRTSETEGYPFAIQSFRK